MGSDEQQRLAMMRELHDAVTHSQSSIALQVMVAEGSEDPVLLRRCLSNIQRLNQVSVIQLRLLDRLLRDAAGSFVCDPLDIPGQRAPTAVAADWQRQLGRQGASVEVSVSMEADRIEVTARNTVSAALDFIGQYLVISMPAGDLSTIEVLTNKEQIRLVFEARSSTEHWLPPIRGNAWKNLQARTALMGGELLCSGKVSARARTRRIELSLTIAAIHDAASVE